MKSLWFNDVKNIDELKQKYKELCKKHHPDLGGSNETMQMVNYAYKRCLNELKTGSGHSSERIQEEEEIEADLMNKIQEIVTIPGIEIEVCSLWIWVSGNTYAVKETLKTKGFWFSPKKTLWFWRPVYAKVYASRRGAIPMEDIRKKYGSIKVAMRERKAFDAE